MTFNNRRRVDVKRTTCKYLIANQVKDHVNLIIGHGVFVSGDPRGRKNLLKGFDYKCHLRFLQQNESTTKEIREDLLQV